MSSTALTCCTQSAGACPRVASGLLSGTCDENAKSGAAGLSRRNLEHRGGDAWTQGGICPALSPKRPQSAVTHRWRPWLPRPSSCYLKPDLRERCPRDSG